MTLAQPFKAGIRDIKQSIRRVATIESYFNRRYATNAVSPPFPGVETPG